MHLLTVCCVSYCSAPPAQKLDAFQIVKFPLTTESAMKKIEDNNTLVSNASFLHHGSRRELRMHLLSFSHTMSAVVLGRA